MTRIKAWQSSTQQECKPRNYERGQSREAATIFIITTIYPAKKQINSNQNKGRIQNKTLVKLMQITPPAYCGNIHKLSLRELTFTPLQMLWDPLSISFRSFPEACKPPRRHSIIPHQLVIYAGRSTVRLLYHRRSSHILLSTRFRDRTFQNIICIAMRRARFAISAAFLAWGGSRSTFVARIIFAELVGATAVVLVGAAAVCTLLHTPLVL